MSDTKKDKSKFWPDYPESEFQKARRELAEALHDFDIAFIELFGKPVTWSLIKIDKFIRWVFNRRDAKSQGKDHLD